MVESHAMDFKKSLAIISELVKNLEPYSYGIRTEINAMKNAGDFIRQVLTFENKKYEFELWQILRQCILALDYTEGIIKNPLRSIKSMFDGSLDKTNSLKERRFVLDMFTAYEVIEYTDEQLLVKDKMKLGMISLLHTLFKLQYSISEHQILSHIASTSKKRYIAFDDFTGKLTETTFEKDKPTTKLIHSFSLNSNSYKLIKYIFEHQADWITYNEIKENVYNNSVNDAKIPQFFKDINLQKADRVNRYIITDRENRRFHFQSIYSKEVLTVDTYRSFIEESK